VHERQRELPQRCHWRFWIERRMHVRLPRWIQRLPLPALRNGLLRLP